MKYSANYKIDSSQIAGDLEYIGISNVNSDFISILFLVGTGSRFEEAEFSGISHALEHMFFKGSSKFPSSIKIAQQIELLGGLTNAFTSYEYTGYFLKVPKMNLNKSLDVFADMILNPIFRAEELDKEKGVILEEIRMYEDIPQEKVRDEFNKNLFKDQPLGRDIAGQEDSLRNIKVKDLQDYMLKYYNKRNSMIVVCGDFESAEVVEKLDELFQGYGKQSSKAEFSKYVKSISKNTYLPIYKESEQCHLVLGGLSYPQNDPEEYNFKIGMNILAQGFGSKLFQNLREKLGIAYYASGGVVGYRDVGKYIITAGIANSRLGEGLHSITNSINEIVESAYSQKDLDRAKSYYISSLLEGIEGVEDKATWYGINRLQKRKVKEPKEVIDLVMAIKKEDVSRSWMNILNRNEQLLCILGPKSTLNHDSIGMIFN